MLSEVNQLQSVLEELTVKSKDPYVLPPSSEQVILDIKGQDGSKWSFPVRHKRNCGQEMRMECYSLIATK